MKRYILLLSLLLVTECTVAQVSLPRRALVGKVNPGKSELIRQTDGSLVYVTATGGNFYSGRLLPNGEIDDAFNGVSYAKKKTDGLVDAKTLAARIDKWGRLLIAGYSQIDSNSGKVATLTRLDRDGNPDAEFIPGIVQLKVGDSSEFNGVHVQPGERIIGIGTCYVDGKYHFFITRLQYNGNKDATFGTDGVIIDNDMPGDNKVVATAIQPDSKYVVLGNSCSEGRCNVTLTRYNADGTKDTEFGIEKYTRTKPPVYENPRAKNLLLLNNGKILVAGECAGIKGGRDIFLMLYAADGTIDTTFSKSDIVRVDVTPDDRIDDILQLADGRILISGAGAAGGERKYNRFIMLRLSPDGKEERKYGYGSDGGFSPASVGAGFTALSHNIALSPLDGKVSRLSELISDNETETVLTFATYLQDSALGIVDIPKGKLQNFVYPVPVAKSVTFSFDLIEDLEISVKLLDAGEKEIATIQAKKLYPEGENSLVINFPQGCKPGKYLVVLSSEVGYKVTVEVTKI